MQTGGADTPRSMRQGPWPLVQTHPQRAAGPMGPTNLSLFSPAAQSLSAQSRRVLAWWKHTGALRALYNPPVSGRHLDTGQRRPRALQFASMPAALMR